MNSYQFTYTKTKSGKKAFRAYVAIWNGKENEVAICAPTLEILEKEWKRIVGIALHSERAQQVWITEAKES